MTPISASHLTAAPVYPVLPAENLSRARSFYHEILGFEVKDMPEMHQFMIDAGSGTHVLVYEREHTKAEHTVATFLVDDVRGTVEELRSRGVKIEEYDLPGLKTVDGIATYDGEEAAWFTDTEGNIIALAHMN